MAVISILAACEGPAPAAKPDILIVLVDTLRPDRLVTWNPAFPLGRGIEDLAQDSVVFDRAYSSSSWTRTAVATLLTGLEARSHGVLEKTDVVPPGLDLLPEVLREHGWRTSAWSANPNVLPIWGFQTGFDSFHDVGALDWTRNKTDATPILEAVLGDLDANRDAPAFHYIHLMDPHAPYRPDVEDVAAVQQQPSLLSSYPGNRADDEAQRLYLDYLGEILDVDAKIADFMRKLQARGRYDESLIVLLSDHGEEFLDHGQLYHGKTLYEEVIRIPLLLKLPGNAGAGTRVAGTVGLSDLAPTLLSWLGLGDSLSADGKSVWSPTDRQFVQDAQPPCAAIKRDAIDLTAILHEQDKLIVARTGDDELFDLARDPHERKNLLASEHSRAATLRELLDRRLAGRNAGWHMRACGTLDKIELRLILSSAERPQSVGFENGDSVVASDTTGGNEWVLRMNLEPRTLQREIFGRIVDEPAGDEDEAGLAAAATELRLRASGRLPFRYALGKQERRQLAFSISLPDGGGDAAVRPSDAVSCWPPLPASPQIAKEELSRREPYVRIWYVQPPERISDRAIDPALQERLRSLGYQW